MVSGFRTLDSESKRKQTYIEYVSLSSIFPAAQQNLGETSPWTVLSVPWADQKTQQRLADLERMVSALCEQLEERPTTYNAQLFDLGDSKYSLAYPLLVVVENYPEEVIARVSEFNLYATGLSDAIALANLKAEIVSTYDRLQELGADNLGAMAFQWLATMKRIIVHHD